MIGQPIDQQMKNGKNANQKDRGELKQKNEMLYKQYKYKYICAY